MREFVWKVGANVVDAINAHLISAYYLHQNKENAPLKTRIDASRIDAIEYCLKKWHKNCLYKSSN
jgi:hypothetical protein